MKSESIYKVVYLNYLRFDLIYIWDIGITYFIKINEFTKF